MNNSSPSDADYFDIEAAILDMRHGDWFLEEHAKRRRQPDTDRLASAIADLHDGMAEKERVSFNLLALDGELSSLQRQLGSLHICAQCAPRTEELADALHQIRNQITELITNRDPAKIAPSEKSHAADFEAPNSFSGISSRRDDRQRQSSAEDFINKACAWLQHLGDATDVPRPAEMDRS